MQFYPNKSQNLAVGNITHTHLTGVGIQSGSHSSKDSGDSRNSGNRLFSWMTPTLLSSKYNASSLN